MAIPSGMEILLRSMLPGLNMESIKTEIEAAKKAIPEFARNLETRVNRIESKLDLILAHIRGYSEPGKVLTDGNGNSGSDSHS